MSSSVFVREQLNPRSYNETHICALCLCFDFISRFSKRDIVLVDINECSSSPCLNGATCTDAVNSYICGCIAGYTGTHCVTGDSLAFSNLYKQYIMTHNLGMCSNKYRTCNLYNLNVFSRSHCLTPIDLALENMIVLLKIYIVSDDSQWYSVQLNPAYVNEIDFSYLHMFDIVLVDNNECSSSPCMNGATCSDAVNSYTCVCVAGYTGTHCETGESLGFSNLCKHSVRVLI